LHAGVVRARRTRPTNSKHQASDVNQRADPRFSKAAPRGRYGGAVTSPEGYLLGLWMHECRRVFGDKLVSHEDKGWLDKQLVDLCKQEFPGELCKQVGAQGRGLSAAYRLRCLPISDTCCGTPAVPTTSRHTACTAPTMINPSPPPTPTPTQQTQSKPNQNPIKTQPNPPPTPPPTGGRAPLLCRLSARARAR